MDTLKHLLRTRPILLILPAAVVLSIVLWGARALFTDHAQYVTGTVEATHVDVAAKIPARVQRFTVEEGQQVQAGDILVKFENREVGAKVEQARAAMTAAGAKYMMALHGARKEEIAMAEKACNQAQWSLDVLKKTYDRMKSLFEEGVISQQQWDEMDYKYRAAEEMRDAAREKLHMVKDGARPEEKEAARGLFLQAKNAVAEAESYYDETSLRSPIGGRVEKKIVNDGELVAAGYPLVTVVDPNSWWVIVNVDERNIGSLQVGETVQCVIPARNGQEIPMRIARMSVLSDFATKKATNELNSFDSRSFEVKLMPEGDTAPMLEGLTVLVPMPR